MFKAVRVIFGEPVWQEFLDGGRLDDVTGKNMITDFASLLEEEHSEVFIAGFVRKLFETNGSAQSGRT